MRVGADHYIYEVVEGWGYSEGSQLNGMITGVHVDSRDRVYAFRRRPSPAVLVYNHEGHFITAWGEGIFSEPHAIWVDAKDHVYCTDREDHTVRQFTAEGKLLMTLGTPHQPGAPGIPFNQPTKAVVAPSGEVFVADGYGQCRIHRFSPDGKLLLSWGEPGQGPGQFNLPHSLVVDQQNRVIVVDRENHRIQLFDLNGNFLSMWTGLKQPMDISIASDNTIFIAEADQRISIFSPTGELLARWGEKGDAPGRFISFLHSICLDSQGNLYIADERRLQKFVRV